MRSIVLSVDHILRFTEYRFPNRLRYNNDTVELPDDHTIWSSFDAADHPASLPYSGTFPMALRPLL